MLQVQRLFQQPRETPKSGGNQFPKSRFEGEGVSSGVYVLNGCV